MGFKWYKMTEFDLLIKNAKILDELGILKDVCIGIKNGKITSIGINCATSSVNGVIDAKGYLAIPSFIDLHVHVFSPGWNKENYYTGSRAAAYGGYGLICDMASVGEWQTTTRVVFEKKIEEVNRNAWIDVALFAGEIYKETDLTEIPELLDMGAVGLGEIMLSEPGPIGDDALLLKSMETVARKDKIIALHCENKDIVNYFTKTLRPISELISYSNARPSIAEAEAILKTAILSKFAKARAHICHISSKEGSMSMRIAKRINKLLTAEVTPHHLLLDIESHHSLGKLGVITPPLRTKQDRVELWRALLLGLIDVISTDHAAFFKEDKERPSDYIDVPPGLPGLEYAFSVVSTYATEHRIASLKDIIELYTSKPAKILKLYPSWGSISMGAEANIVLVDYRREVKIDDSWIISASDYSPYLGWRVRFQVMYNIHRGEIVMEDKVLSSKNGRFLGIENVPSIEKKLSRSRGIT